MTAPRPLKLKDFLGQESIVEQVEIKVASAKYRDKPFPHMVMGGPPGLGKTTLASIIANEMDGELISRISTAITKAEDLVELFSLIRQPNTIIFIDEVEQLDRKMTELLHTAMEDRKFTAKMKNGKIVEIDLPEFSLMAATNYLGELPRPFLDRFKIQVNFEPYSHDEIFTILVNVVKKMQIKATKDGVREIALRSRGVPRIAIRYLEDARDVAIAYKEFDCVVSRSCVAKAFDVNEIDDLGLNDLDRRILYYLHKTKKPVGLKTLSQAVDEDDSTINLSEGYLLRSGLIERTTKGRTITSKGKKHLEEVVA
jgi:Holliday junction DNA helicase RuvB